MNKKLLTSFALGATCLLAPSLYADTAILNSVAQVGIRDDIATTNQNSDSQVIVGNTANGNGRTLHGLVRFDTSSIVIPVGQTISITNVTLSADLDASPSSMTIEVYDYAYDFGHTTATWNNPAGDGSDSTAGGTTGIFLSSEGMNNVATETFSSSTNFITITESAINGDDTVNLLLKRNTFQDANVLTRFVNSNAAFKLNITYDLVPVPEPSSFALLAGCFGLAWVMVRRRG